MGVERARAEAQAQTQAAPSAAAAAVVPEKPPEKRSTGGYFGQSGQRFWGRRR